jgi:3-oxoacyl-[acyl-carrier protein] reductase
MGASCEVLYSTTKAAVIGLTKALAKELGPSNIQVNCVAPGVIDTDMNADLDQATFEDLKEQTPLGAIGKGIDVAETVLFLASEKSNFITGQVISPNGGFLI